MDWDTISGYIHSYGYLAVAIGAVLDHSGLSNISAIGAAVAKYTGELSFWGVIIAATAGMFASDLIFYAIGRWRAGWIERIVRSEKGRLRLHVLRQHMKKYAWPLLIFGRFLPFLGRFVPAVAGIGGIGPARLCAACLAGSGLSALGFAAIGYFAGEWIKQFDEYALWAGIGAFIVGLFIVGYIFKHINAIVERELDRKE